MRTAVKIIVTLIVLTGLVIAYWLISPLFFSTEVNEPLPDTSVDGENKAVLQREVSRGTFDGVDGHTAQGTAKLFKVGEEYFIRFEPNFKITNGPDLHVYFGKNGKYDARARLAELKGSRGSQNYDIPHDIDPLDYNEIWIWCRAFRVGFGRAILF